MMEAGDSYVVKLPLETSQQTFRSVYTDHMRLFPLMSLLHVNSLIEISGTHFVPDIFTLADANSDAQCEWVLTHPASHYRNPPGE